MRVGNKGIEEVLSAASQRRLRRLTPLVLAALLLGIMLAMYMIAERRSKPVEMMQQVEEPELGFAVELPPQHFKKEYEEASELGFFNSTTFYSNFTYGFGVQLRWVAIESLPMGLLSLRDPHELLRRFRDLSLRLGEVEFENSEVKTWHDYPALFFSTELEGIVIEWRYLLRKNRVYRLGCGALHANDRRCQAFFDSFELL